MNRFSAALLLISLVALILISNHSGVHGIPQEQDPNCNCRKNYAPVCGTDGKTYSNECVLSVETKGICGKTKSSITKAYDGACKEASA